MYFVTWLGEGIVMRFKIDLDGRTRGFCGFRCRSQEIAILTAKRNLVHVRWKAVDFARSGCRCRDVPGTPRCSRLRRTKQTALQVKKASNILQESVYILWIISGSNYYFLAYAYNSYPLLAMIHPLCFSTTQELISPLEFKKVLITSYAPVAL
jgi:hypothetical protein